MIVVADVPETNETLYVSVTTWHEGSDDTCILGPGDHDFIKHKSRIAYERAEFHNRERLQREVDSGKIPRSTPVTKEVLHRIIAGFRTSPEASRKFRYRFSSLFPDFRD